MVKKSWKLAVISLAILVAGGAAYAANVSAGESISEAEAKQIALSEVKGADISHISKFAKDQDDDRQEYDVEIIYNGYEYDFEISAKDGSIFDRNKEKADPIDIAKVEAKQEQQASEQVVVVEQERAPEEPSNSGSSSQPSGISLEKAKSIAVGQVSGASSGDIVKAFKDYDDGRVEYDVEIRHNGYEYEFEIDGESGKILSKGIDRIEYDDWDDRYDD